MTEHKPFMDYKIERRVTAIIILLLALALVVTTLIGTKQINERDQECYDLLRAERDANPLRRQISQNFTYIMNNTEDKYLWIPPND